MKYFLPLSLLILPFNQAFSQKAKFSPLDQKVTMIVHPQEILESVIFRLKEETGRIEYSSLMLAPFKAKVIHYKNATVRQILDQQLEGTSIQYRLKGNTILIVNSLSAKNKK